MTVRSQITEVDARGLNCPLPVLRTKKTLKDLEPGDLLKLLATDPGSVLDMEAFCRQTGHRLLESQSVGEEFHFLIQKS